MSWREIQKADQQVAGDLYRDSGFIVTNSLGDYVEPRTFKDYYNQILKLAGLRIVLTSQFPDTIKRLGIGWHLT